MPDFEEFRWTECNKCSRPLKTFVSKGMDGDGGDFYTLLVWPCENCMDNSELRGRSLALYGLLEEKTEFDKA